MSKAFHFGKRMQFSVSLLAIFTLFLVLLFLATPSSTFVSRSISVPWFVLLPIFIAAYFVFHELGRSAIRLKISKQLPTKNGWFYISIFLILGAILTCLVSHYFG